MEQINNLQNQGHFEDIGDLPQILSDDCGEIALAKMEIFIPEELKPYIIHNEKELLEKLFQPKEILDLGEKGLSEYRVVIIGRVSTCGDLQDPRSPINQAITVLHQQKRRRDFVVLGVILDFFKNGASAEGRMFQDLLVNYLGRSVQMCLKPKFNAVCPPELSRMSRSVVETVNFAEKCHYFRIKLIDYFINTDYADPVNRQSLLQKASKSETEVSDTAFRIASTKFSNFLRDRTLPGKHFGFRVKNVREVSGKRKRVLYSHWVRVENEISIIFSMFQVFAEAGNITTVQNAIFEKFGLKFDKPFIWKMLTSTKYIGIIFRPPKERVRHYDSRKIIHRDIPLPQGTIISWEKKDEEHIFKYYVKDLDIVPMELFEQVQTILKRKRDNIKILPHRTNRAHAPAGENGKTAYTGILVCKKCGGFYKMGAKGFLYCSNHRKKRCKQKHGIQLEFLNRFFREMLSQIITHEMPEFTRAYKYEFAKRINRIDADINALSRKIATEDADLVLLVKDSKNIIGPAKDRLDLITIKKAQNIQSMENALSSMRNQQNFIKGDYQYNLNAAKKWIQDLNYLFKNPDAPRLNEMLRSIILKVEMEEVAGVLPNSFKILGRVIFHQVGFVRFFNDLSKVGPFFSDFALPEQPGTIVPTCSVNSEIHVNFALTVLSGVGARAKNGNVAKTQYRWMFIPADNFSPAGAKILTTRSSSVSLQVGGQKEQKAVSIISFNLFEDDDPKPDHNHEMGLAVLKKQNGCKIEVRARRHRTGKVICRPRMDVSVLSVAKPKIESYSLFEDDNLL